MFILPLSRLLCHNKGKLKLRKFTGLYIVAPLIKYFGSAVDVKRSILVRHKYKFWELENIMRNL